MAAVTKPMSNGLFPPSFFENGPAGPGVHALTIVGRMLNDPELAYGKGADPNSSSRFTDAIERSGERLRGYFKEWSAAGNIHEKYEEIVFLVCSLYGFSGWRKDQAFKANFFM